MTRHLTTIRELSRADAEYILAATAEFKKRWRRGETGRDLSGRMVGLFFEKASTRTRLSFEAAVAALGGTPTFVDHSKERLGKREALKDFARVVSRYLRAVVLRTYEQKTVDEVARHASVPVINGLSDHEHPCQALADLFTIREKFGDLAGRRLAFIGDGNNVARSLARLCRLLDVEFAIASPKGYELSDVRKEAAGGKGLFFVEDPAEAVRGADALYADVWTSMGDKETPERLAAFAKYRIDGKLLNLAKPGAIALHCLPAHRGQEITDEVMDGPQAAVYDQSENRMHVSAGVLQWVLKT
ncbi:MAG: ornithine carbamoyltransferase [Planctomycetota bacterium]